MPRQMRYTTHDASQALATSSNNNYTKMWVQIFLVSIQLVLLPRKQRVEVASQAQRGSRSRQGIGFASAIETYYYPGA